MWKSHTEECTSEQEVVEEGQGLTQRCSWTWEAWAQLDDLCSSVGLHLVKDDGTMDTNMGSGAQLPGSKSAGFSNTLLN